MKHTQQKSPKGNLQCRKHLHFSSEPVSPKVSLPDSNSDNDIQCTPALQRLGNLAIMEISKHDHKIHNMHHKSDVLGKS
jgi:hypothetical protein